ncbi:MAG: hypothetical protein R3200_08800 [Xanthomonadales bacterium]|nr:hypothetical protein [Xanthomonadales bacterium]
MLNAFGWVIFGMAVWGLCIAMSALQRRFAPEMGDDHGTFGGDLHQHGRRHRQRETERDAERDAELAALRRRVETLEAIVTDRKYQWEQEYEQAS